MASLNYNHTCPVIDQALEDYHTHITESIKNYLETRVPNKQLWEDYEYLSQDMYTDFEQEAETLRTTNIALREAAETQLDELEEEFNSKISELEDEIVELNSVIIALEGKVEFLENRESKLLEETELLAIKYGKTLDKLLNAKLDGNN